MAMYAMSQEEMIFANDAKDGQTYWCMDCFSPVKKKRGKRGTFHFYHLKAAPSCRFYSKTEGHFLAQLQLQRLFPQIQIERPFSKIHRIADCCLEEEKIVFEVQCSRLLEKEAERRIQDYRSVGYEVVWLLDDRRYNQRRLKPEEAFLRCHCGYFASIKKNLFYDQFEVFRKGRRVKKGNPLILNLQKIYRRPQEPLDEALLPKQILQLDGRLYFQNDRLFKAIRKEERLLDYWKKAESAFKKSWFKEKVLYPYLTFLRKAIKIDLLRN